MKFLKKAYIVTFYKDKDVNKKEWKIIFNITFSKSKSKKEEIFFPNRKKAIKYFYENLPNTRAFVHGNNGKFAFTLINNDNKEIYVKTSKNNDFNEIKKELNELKIQSKLITEENENTLKPTKATKLKNIWIILLFIVIMVWIWVAIYLML